jgi:2-methylisocitrate lyase-like PEP mutase family enzyme
VYDGVSAKLVESMGFETASISGAGVSNSRLGLPDYGFLDRTANVAHSSRIVDAVDIPVHADGDTGYGNALSVHQTVERLEKAGVASIMIEDQEWPKRCGHMEGKSVVPREEMVQKIQAAVEARSDPNLIIRARTDATAPYGREEAVERLNTYADAGAELVFADALLTEEDIEYVCQNTVAPCVVNMGYGIRKRPTTPLLSPDEAEELGAAMITYPRLITGSAVKGMQQALSTLQESVETGEVIERPDQTLSFDDYTDLIGLPEMKELEEKFAK